ncbi:MAG: hypothetical protein KJT01_05140 [Gemmatimonadetes bacterium]|nr:hypothetical protein [Gemmatimonadota bacterium]
MRRERLGVPQSGRAVHDDPQLQLPSVVAGLTRHLDDFLRYTQAILTRDA